jgi:hypothetical protein
MSGFNQRKNGIKNRDVCADDIKSLEATEISAIQISNGSQYLRKMRKAG